MSSQWLESSQPRKFEGQPCTTTGCEKLATYTLADPEIFTFRRSCQTCREETVSWKQMDGVNVDYW
jgi:hypothetical protein